MPRARRGKVRLDTLCGAHIRVDGNEHAGIVVNLSLTGSQLLTDVFVPEGKVVEFCFHFDSIAEPIETTAQVIWCSEVSHSDQYGLGLSFIEFSKPNQFQQLFVTLEEETNRRENILAPYQETAAPLSEMTPLEAKRIAFLARLSRRLNRSHEIRPPPKR